MHFNVLKHKTLLQSLFYMLTFLILISCQKTSVQNQSMDTQGLFEFPSDFSYSSDGDIPDYLDQEKVLCNGKGLKVAKCISNQLKRGICLGIIKHEKRVFAVEIPCESVKQTPNDTLPDFGD